MRGSELQDLIEKSLNEVANDEESRALEERLLADEKARDHYLKEVYLHGSLRRRFSTSEESVPAGEVARFPGRRLVVGMALAACLVLFFGGITLMAPQETPATIVHAVGAYDERGESVEVGENVTEGVFELSKGIVSLDFSSGARLSVEGPARIEVVDEMKVLLSRGVVTANIPESAIGFVVDTPAAHVVDLGTSFGVSVNEGGLTDVCVFDGEVEVSSVETGKGSREPHLLREGEAVRAMSSTSSVDVVAYDTTAFAKTWPVASGVLQTTGAMRFVSPGPNAHPGNYPDSEHIVVFPERKGVFLKEGIKVDMVDPGNYLKKQHQEKPVLVTEERVTSYLLQLYALPENGSKQRKMIRGQISFAKPVVGVIMAGGLLKSSEPMFRRAGSKYPNVGMIEGRPLGDTRPGFDSVVLAADRRTLIVELGAPPGKLDQFRVLVEAD